MAVTTLEVPMNTTDVIWNRGSRSVQQHQHAVTLTLDTLDWARFRAFLESDLDVVIVDARMDADRVIVRAGCPSAEVADRLHDAWG